MSPCLIERTPGFIDFLLVLAKEIQGLAWKLGTVEDFQVRYPNRAGSVGPVSVAIRLMVPLLSFWINMHANTSKAKYAVHAIPP
jgi:hypothetical protein